MIVDRVYEEGHRRPGDLAELRRRCIRGRGAFVWIPPTTDGGGVSMPCGASSSCTSSRWRTRSRLTRLKLEVYDDSMLLVLKPAPYVRGEEAVAFGEIRLFVAEYLTATARPRCTTSGSAWRTAGFLPAASAALHAIVDHVVDDYLR